VRSLLAFVIEQGTEPGYARHQIVKSETEVIEIVKNSDLGVRFALEIRGRLFISSGTIQDDDVVSLRRALEGVVEDLDS
jgi:hypothetical protein